VKLRLAALCLFVAALPSCREEAPRRPNILLIVIDTLRADRLGCYGNRRGLTPFLDSLAARGVLFENAYAPSSWTVPSVASLFTSRHALQHGAATFEARLPSAEIALAEKLDGAGYATGGLSANFRLSMKTGFAQGFRHFRAYVPPRASVPVVRGDRLRLDALAWLDRARAEAARQPVFLYLQYMEPHQPYEPPEPHRSRFAPDGHDPALVSAVNRKIEDTRFEGITPEDRRLLEDLYDGEVAAVDAEIAALFDRLERRGFLRDAIVVVTSDHGEEFGEHGLYTHGHSLYQSAIRVPLIVVAPAVPARRVVGRNVSLVDLAPTLLDLAGLPPEPRFEGRSLAGLFTGNGAAGASRTQGNDGVLSELPQSGQGIDIRRHEHAWMHRSQKLLVTPYGSHVMTDLQHDPDESRLVAADDSDTGRVLMRELRDRLADLARRSAPERETIELDEATREKLRALGYH
jgi:arylsulfatase A-like enzyme